jgi:type II secretory pathway pseudopilin PulG
MPMVILIVVVVMGIAALAIWRSMAIKSDRRRQEQDSAR